MAQLTNAPSSQKEQHIELAYHHPDQKEFIIPSFSNPSSLVTSVNFCTLFDRKMLVTLELESVKTKYYH